MAEQYQVAFYGRRGDLAGLAPTYGYVDLYTQWQWRTRAMGRVRVHLDDEIEKRMRASAKAMKLSTSKWIANAIREKPADEWPANVRELAGSWKGFPTLDALCEM